MERVDQSKTESMYQVNKESLFVLYQMQLISMRIKCQSHYLILDFQNSVLISNLFFFQIFFLVFGFSAVQAQKLTGVTEETSEECKVRTDYTKWIAKGETLAKVDFDGKQDKPVQFEAQRGSWFNFRDAATTKVL